VPIPTFTLTGNVYDILDTNNDGSVDTVALSTATVTFSPNTNGQFIAIGDNIYRPEAVTVTVDQSGRINGNAGVVLLANDASLNLVIPLQWKVSLTFTSDFARRPKSWFFEAPESGKTVTLGSVSAIPSTFATGFSRGPAGPTGATGPAGTSSWSSLTGVPSSLTAGSNVANGFAGLDSGGLIPAALLPSYVDDVLEYTNLAGFPATGETGKIFVDKATQKIFRWSGSTYIEISPSPGSTDSVTEGATNLYFTTARASSASPVQSVAGKTGTVTLTVSDIAPSTSTALGVGSLELSHASDTTVSRSAAGVIAVEGFDVTTTSVVSVTSSTTLAAIANRHYVVLLGSGATPTLPTAVGNTSIYHLKNVHTASIAVALTSSQTIDGGTGSLTILPKQSFSLVSDNSNWWII
jgi:hypothetical protein